VEQVVGQVVIGVDPHKSSATIEVLDGREQVVLTGRLGTDRTGYRSMLALGRRWPDRVWAVEGSHGIGRHVAQRLRRPRRVQEGHRGPAASGGGQATLSRAGSNRPVPKVG